MGIDWIFCSLGEKIAVPKGCPKHWCSLEARGARGWDQRYRLPPGVMVAPGKGRISDRGTICMTCKQELLWSFPATHRAACHLASLPLAHGWGWREGEGNRKVRPGLRKGCDPGEEALLPLSSSLLLPRLHRDCKCEGCPSPSPGLHDKWGGGLCGSNLFHLGGHSGYLAGRGGNRGPLCSSSVCFLFKGCHM